jgi:hypothetical protein
MTTVPVSRWDGLFLLIRTDHPVIPYAWQDETSVLLTLPFLPVIMMRETQL